MNDGASWNTKESEFALARRLMDGGVFLHPGEEHCARPGWFRLVFTQNQHVLKVGLKRYNIYPNLIHSLLMVCV